ncbi:2,3-bisphosphoglycerate-dependent phosphoglycerate mutase [Chlamydiales bacterium SCGC AG-110-P3]|nr:2,3-bisphosphoglycerate-dependent phosphoglycerate mutase [Chlamydiales bacterium SCGC AG-110-P3]
MAKLILMRHGQSQWNLKNQFTGWVDVSLSAKGIEEALEGGEVIADMPIDVIYTSTLMRAQITAMLAMSRHHAGKVPVVVHPEDSQLEEWGKIHSDAARDDTIPVYEAWELNERMYGELQGLNKAATAEKYGDHQVKLWRRSYDVAPPAGESLEMTAARAIPYYKNTIVSALLRGENVFVSAHGNSLRAIIMEIDGLSKDEVLQLEVPTGEPIIYEVTFKKDGLPSYSKQLTTKHKS